MEQRTRNGEHGQRGYALMAALIVVALVALATTVPLHSEQQRQQRERETELLFAGRQIRDAIERYRDASPGGVPQGPGTLQDLLEDRRHPSPRRHLRRLYRDPFTNAADWQLLREQGAIVGVASRSTVVPLQRHGFAPEEANFAEARHVADWHFLVRGAAAGSGAVPAAPSEPTPGPPPGGGPSPAPPGTPAPPGPRGACLAEYGAAVQACLGAIDPSCRQLARERLRQCLQV
jgi:type II secretory pathway pseudopilin PulG